jgi:hypothetical protein
MAHTFGTRARTRMHAFMYACGTQQQELVREFVNFRRQHGWPLRLSNLRKCERVQHALQADFHAVLGPRDTSGRKLISMTCTNFSAEYGDPKCFHKMAGTYVVALGGVLVRFVLGWLVHVSITVYNCLFVVTSACLFVCLSITIYSCMYVCLAYSVVCLYIAVCLSVRLSAHLFVQLYVCLSVCLPA